jgi:hypothetical protein
MKNDLYTKAVLTVIAVSLVVIALKPIIHPEIASAQTGAFSGVQMSAAFSQGTGLYFMFFDPKTGRMWRYRENDPAVFSGHQLTKLGEPFTDIK